MGNKKRLKEILKSRLSKPTKKAKKNNRKFFSKLEKTICNNCINNTFDKCEPLDEKYSKVINYKNWENE